MSGKPRRRAQRQAAMRKWDVKTGPLAVLASRRAAGTAKIAAAGVTRAGACEAVSYLYSMISFAERHGCGLAGLGEVIAAIQHGADTIGDGVATRLRQEGGTP